MKPRARSFPLVVVWIFLGAGAALGFEGVSNVHVGRLVELDVPDASQVAAMCEQLLANPLIEDYEIQTVEDGK